MTEKWIAKDKFKPKALTGISDKQIEYHFETHYKGYVNKLNEVWEKLEKTDRSKANQSYSEYRELKVEETFNHCGSLLHELYFEALGDGSKKPGPKFTELITRDFGSYEKWIEDFKALSTAFRGWAVLVFDLNTGTFRNIGSDAHNMYHIWNAIVVLTLDTYEHAYYVDYGPKRAAYIDALLGNIKWDIVETRVNKALKAYDALN